MYYIILYIIHFCCLCHEKLIDSAKEIICTMPSQKHNLAINFQKVFVSNAPIKNGRIVIENGMITFEHHTDSINVDGVRDRGTYAVDSSEQNSNAIGLHS